MNPRGDGASRVLSGVRVVELSTEVAGAFATKYFASFGADVIKVEPPGGDPTRLEGPRRDDGPDASLLFAYLNTGKRGIVLDHHDQSDLDRLHRLLLTADVIVESAAPGEWAARGIDFDAIMAARPSTIVCSITPFGQDGPRAPWTATALTAFASGGEMALCGELDDSPLNVAGPQAFYQAGLHAFAGCMMGLFAARRSGVGDRIDISMQEVQVASLQAAGPNALVNGADNVRTGNQWHALWGIYPSQDGYVGVAAMARQTAAVYRAIGQPEFADDPAFRDMFRSPERNDLLTALVSSWAAERTSSQIYDEAGAYRAPFSWVLSPRELIDWPPLVDVGFWHEVDHPVLGKHVLPAAPFSLDGSRGDVARSPLLNEHAEEILGELSAAAVTPLSTPLPPPVSGTPRPFLDGIRVLDMSQVWAGPFAARLLADMGADVIHIEGPAFPDAIRGAGSAQAKPRGYNTGPFFNELNRNKRGLSLDVARPEGRATFMRLVEQSDVLIENWSAGVADSLGIGYEELRKVNPGIIMVQMPGFEPVGTESSRLGYGPTIEQMGGLVGLQGYEGGPPHQSGVSYGDPVAGATAAGAAALALVKREATRGEGAHITVVQRNAIIAVIGEFIAAESVGASYPVRIGNGHPVHAPHNVYRTRDDAGRWQQDPQGNQTMEFHDTWIAIAVDSDGAWHGLTGVIDDPALKAQSYETAAGRRAAEHEIDEVIARWVRERSPEQIAEQLQAAGVSASPVLTPLMLARDAHLNLRGAFANYDHPDVGVRPTTRPVLRLGNRPFDGIRRAAPCFGQHNAEVLREIAGCSAEEFDRMVESGLVTDAPV